MTSTINHPLNRKLRMGLIGGGGEGFIGRVHALAAGLDQRAELVAGAFSSDPDKSRLAAAAFGVAADRGYGSYRDLIECRNPRPEIRGGFRGALGLITAGNGRFRRYLVGCFLDGFCQMLYFPLIWAFLSRDLGFGYVGCSVLMHAVPALAAFVATGALGRFLDRTSPWISWAWIRCLWGLDAILLAATPTCAILFPPALVILPVLGRLLRGSVQGGWWIMWWQIGVTYFAPPGEDTSRYMGVMVFLNGSIRLLASAAGIGLTALSIPPGVLLIAGGMGVMLSGLYSLWQASWERQHRGPETISEFEHLWGGEGLTPVKLD